MSLKIPVLLWKICERLPCITSGAWVIFAPKWEAIPWWPRHTPRMGICVSRFGFGFAFGFGLAYSSRISLPIAKSSFLRAVPGPGERIMWLGLCSRISLREVFEWFRTVGSVGVSPVSFAVSSPIYCARIWVKESSWSIKIGFIGLLKSGNHYSLVALHN